jgi:hypothetical protein
MRTRPPSKTVAIVIPAPASQTLSPDEQTSLRHLRHFLGRSDTFLIAPEGRTIHLDGIRTIHVPSKFFGALAANNNLDYWPGLYEAFSDYKFILWYHLDCLVFSDQLEAWCAEGLDYTGPPWIRCPDSPWVETDRVGNGGFALLNVQQCLRALRARHAKVPKTHLTDLIARNSDRVRPVVQLLYRFRRLAPRSRALNALLHRWEVIQNPGKYNLNSDYFFSDKAAAYLPGFKVASLEQGLRFGFEVGPRTCFEMSGRRMPFGCHAWARYDRSFWEPYLL